MDVNTHARNKWNNFIQRHYTYLTDMGFSDKQLSTDWNTIAAYITLAYLYRPMIDEEDEAK